MNVSSVIQRSQPPCGSFFTSLPLVYFPPRPLLTLQIDSNPFCVLTINLTKDLNSPDKRCVMSQTKDKSQNLKLTKRWFAVKSSECIILLRITSEWQIFTFHGFGCFFLLLDLSHGKFDITLHLAVTSSKKSV